MPFKMILFLSVLTLSASIPFLPLSSNILSLRYENTSWLLPGSTLSIYETKTEPILSTNSLNQSQIYLILLVDLDVLHGTTTTTILHWYQSELVPDPNTDNRTLTPKPDSWQIPKAKYVGPQPPGGSQPHRYVFLLFEQDDDYVFPECFSGFLPLTVENRSGFDVRQFIGVARLGPLKAVNFIVVGPGDGNSDRRRSRASTTAATTTSLRSAPCIMTTGGGRTGAGPGQVVL